MAKKNYVSVSLHSPILTDDTIFQYEVTADFKPYRRKAEYKKVTEVESQAIN